MLITRWNASGGVKGRQKARGEDLHVLGQDHQLDAVLRQQLEMTGLRVAAVGIADRHMGELGAELLGDRPQIRMVGDHQRHPHRQLARAHAPEQIQ